MGDPGFGRAKRDRGQCNVCGRSQPVGPKEWLRAARPRCVACGGSLYRVGKWNGSVDVASVNTPSDVAPPKTDTEFEIQAYLFAELRRVGLRVRGCVPVRGGSEVFDLVVFDADWRPVRIIEVKKGTPLVGAAVRKQVRRYERFGVPVDLVCGMRRAEKYAREAAFLLSAFCLEGNAEMSACL